MLAPNPMKGIRRIDRPQKRLHGFETAIKRGDKYHSKFFSDRAHGGREPALAAALAYYPVLLAKVGPPGSNPLPSKIPLRDGVALPGPPQNPSPGSLVWVQCPDQRCLAYRDEHGHWFSFYTHRQLREVIRILY